MRTVVLHLPILLLLLVLPLTFPLFQAEGAQPVPVIVKKVETSRFTDRVEALGTLRAKESVEITATITDTITAIHFEDGQRVQKGDILIEMTSAEEHALLEEEMSTLSEAKKQFKRLETLANRGATATAIFDEQQRKLDTAQARLRGIESRLRDRLIIAPFSGVVGLRNISVGALIEPGDRITTLDDDSIMKLDFTIPSVHLAAIHKGLVIEAKSSAYGERVFNGQIDSIDSRIDPATRAIVVRAILANEERLLKPGLLMTVTLLKNPRDGLVVPEEALIPSGKSNNVLVVQPEASPTLAEQREVQIGVRRPGEVEIVEGLTAGEYVIIHGTQRVRPGQPVSVIASAEGGEPLRELLRQKQGDMAK
ncbi:efflux RND transporter periplasmic adaptor subunit [Desulfosediminicola flagellatus]|uniref:efflux RND transporter periplasmic adaptor subunit n=1 Tax=Desulfosediminicola flagellatus TaxID=2569541 RepID=UPI001C3E86C0|nr:efflux RND transporter periplasmic adaptor subunit [Desulfosediminicola flagellatus]